MRARNHRYSRTTGTVLYLNSHHPRYSRRERLTTAVLRLLVLGFALAFWVAVMYAFWKAVGA